MGWKVCFSSMSMMAADGVSEVKLRLAGWRAKSEEPSGVVSQVVTFWACEATGRDTAKASNDFTILGFTVAPGGFGCDGRRCAIHFRQRALPIRGVAESRDRAGGRLPRRVRLAW